MYCNTVAITFRMYTVCIQCVYSVYTVCIQCVYNHLTVAKKLLTFILTVDHTTLLQLANTRIFACIQWYTTLLQLQWGWLTFTQWYSLIIQLSCNHIHITYTLLTHYLHREFRVHTVFTQPSYSCRKVVEAMQSRVSLCETFTYSYIACSHSNHTTLLQLLTPRFSHSYSDLQLFFNCNTVDWHPPTQ